ncbi:uncharacterized protein LOC102720905 isoform X2 [Oryza brachyantha]|uniref:uncharacterized protein LOC102720905 isoform X2 n=1 Tax=Oryza brachyantha TaxID=4533 RepID=UPI000776785A|nr:uncharacterized protein LOC102720905 isoform X2 [Oryza brachyantha]
MNGDKVHDKETHGTSSDITNKTSVDKVKAPNLFERAKEEVEALVGAVHNKMEHNSSPRGNNDLHKDSKDDSKAAMNKMETHKNETHGTSDDINENTPVEKVKGPNVFERAKEEIEAIVEAFHPKKGSDK